MDFKGEKLQFRSEIAKLSINAMFPYLRRTEAGVVVIYLRYPVRKNRMTIRRTLLDWFREKRNATLISVKVLFLHDLIKQDPLL